MGKLVRRQHVVSRFYLKGFASASDQVRRVVLPGDQSNLVSTSDATVIKDFYTVTMPDGSQSDFFEKALSRAEAPAAEAIQAVIEGEWPVQANRRKALALWVALQHLRTEDIRDSQNDMTAGLIRLLVGASGKDALRRHIEQAEKRAVPDEELDWEWKDLTKPGGPDLEPNVKQHLGLIASESGAWSRYLTNCHWTLYKFERRSLITSDHPVSLIVGPDHPPGQGVGLATADLFLVPLSRRLALTIQPRRRLPSGFESTADFDVVPGVTKYSRAFNYETARRARKCVYHHPDDQPLDGLSLPQPQSGPSTGWADMDGLIREEGLFHGLTAEQRRAMGRMPRPEPRSAGFTLNDLPWPIPRRRKITSTGDGSDRPAAEV